MIVELFSLAAEFGNLATNKTEEALVDGLSVAFVGQGFRCPWS